VDPAYRFLEREMIEWAEHHLAARQADEGGRALEFVVFEYDALRQRLLAERAFEKMAYGGMFRHMRLPACPLAGADVAYPYKMREVDPAEDDDCQRIADLLNAAFGRSFHNGPEFQNFARLAPCYVNDLDLVAVAPNGVFAAYVGMPYDEINRRGIFEPVCTHPQHRRKGLANALMREALHRVQAIGAVDAIVDTGDMIPANALYESMGFAEADKAFAWRKTRAA
jgi:ribosomal protein S18 acetylase RimI-like enzyme